MIHNMKYSVVYPRSTVSNDILQKVLTMVPPTATKPAASFTSMILILYIFDDALEDTIDHLKVLKSKGY